jgi:magnesium transporter
VEGLLRANHWHELRHSIEGLHPADLAELLRAMSSADRVIVFRLLRRTPAVETFAYLGVEEQRELMRVLPERRLVFIVAHMRPDDRARLLEELPPDVRADILRKLPPSEIRHTVQLLSYPEDTAGRYMTTNYATIRPDMTAAEALAHIRATGRGKETLDILFIVDRDGNLLEDLRLGNLVLADPETVVTDIEDPGLVSLLDTTPRDEVLRMFEKYDRVALPVTAPDRRLLGIITVDDVLDVAEAEATSDIQKMGGAEALDAPYRDVGFWSMFRKRGGWLSALFLGEMLTATAMGHYEAEIARAVVLALFVPLIISSGGNSGSQATSIIIRALALQELRLRDWVRVFSREALSGLALGTLLGGIGFLRIVLWQRLGFNDYGPHYLMVAATVWLSLMGVVCFGTLTGSMLPFLLRRLGFDPATSSAPFVATLVDVTGLVIYFRVAAVLLRGALL